MKSPKVMTEAYKKSLIESLPKAFPIEMDLYSLEHSLIFEAFKKDLKPLYDLRVKKAKYLLKLESDPTIVDMNKEECKILHRKVNAIYKELLPIHNALVYMEALVDTFKTTHRKQREGFLNILENSTQNQKNFYSMFSKKVNNG